MTAEAPESFSGQGFPEETIPLGIRSEPVFSTPGREWRRISTGCYRSAA
jgi:hypothetical protein